MEEVAIRSAIPIAAGQRQTAAAFVGDTLGMSAAFAWSPSRYARKLAPLTLSLAGRGKPDDLSTD